LDNKIYFAAGRNPKTLTHRGKPLPAVSGVDLRFDPRTEKFERVTGGLQFGHTMDRWGTRFVCSNSNHMQQVVYPQRYLARNPYFAPSGLVRSVAIDGASARVFRTSPPEPWRIVRQKWRALDKGYRLVFNKDGGWEFIPLDPTKKKGSVPTEYPVGYFTSATGITIYRGDAYPREFQGNAFVGDVGGNLVHRKTVNTEGVIYQAQRADAGTEFLRSTDNWFRPVNFVNAPDGTLYVLDMYRETVEHPYSIPEEIKAFLFLTSGIDRGRIYRLVSPGMKRVVPVRPGELEMPELVKLLGSDNGWMRTTAQRLLWERQDKRAIPLLGRFLAETDRPLGRLHALCTLDGLGALRAEHLLVGLKDDHPRVRTHAIRLSESLLNKYPQLVTRLLELAADKSEHVRFQLAFSLGETTDPRALDGLARLARDADSSQQIQVALLSSVGTTADQLATILMKDEEFIKQSRAGSMLAQLAPIVGANSKTGPSLRLLLSATAADVPLSIQQAVLTGLGEGLGRRGSSLARLLDSDSVPVELTQQLSGLFERAANLASDGEQLLATRQRATRILAFADFTTAIKHLPGFLLPQVPQSLQRAAVYSLAEQQSDEIVAHLLAAWRGLSPPVRRDVVDSIFSRPARIELLLSAVKSGAIKRHEIERDKKQLLLKHPNATIRQLSQQLFAGEVDSDRAKVVAEYQGVLDLEGDALRGLEVFKKKCAACHQVGDVGHRIAPDLVSVQNKSAADLLLAVLDPNREAQPNFNVYSVVTGQGRIISGIITSETASSITLLQADSKRAVVLRSNIEELVSTGVSLMPEGLEKELKQQDLADVIAFIKSIKPAEPGK
jgi:putative membrane-bound dehydrogenase-like protein